MALNTILEKKIISLYTYFSDKVIVVIIVCTLILWNSTEIFPTFLSEKIAVYLNFSNKMEDYASKKPLKIGTP